MFYVIVTACLVAGCVIFVLFGNFHSNPDFFNQRCCRAKCARQNSPIRELLRY